MVLTILFFLVFSGTGVQDQGCRNCEEDASGFQHSVRPSICLVEHGIVRCNSLSAFENCCLAFCPWWESCIKLESNQTAQWCEVKLRHVQLARVKTCHCPGQDSELDPQQSRLLLCHWVISGLAIHWRWQIGLANFHLFFFFFFSLQRCRTQLALGVGRLFSAGWSRNAPFRVCIPDTFDGRSVLHW